MILEYLDSTVSSLQCIGLFQTPCSLGIWRCFETTNSTLGWVGPLSFCSYWLILHLKAFISMTLPSLIPSCGSMSNQQIGTQAHAWLQIQARRQYCFCRFIRRSTSLASFVALGGWCLVARRCWRERVCKSLLVSQETDLQITFQSLDSSLAVFHRQVWIS